MKFVSYFYILILLLCERTWKIHSSADFDVEELEHLSKKLRPIECIKLLESIYLRTPAYVVKDEKNENPAIQPTQEDCLLKLDQWNRMFPGDNNEQARTHMVNSLRQIKRTDLANVIKRNKRLIRIVNNYVKPGDVYLYHKYLPIRYSKRLLYQLDPDTNDKSEDENLNERHLVERSLETSNSSFKSNLQKHFAKKEADHSKGVKSKGQSESKNKKFQARQPTSPESANKTCQNHWLIVAAIAIAILGVIVLSVIVYFCKTGKGRFRCDPRCKGYEHFPRDSESGWVTSSTDMTSRKGARSSSANSVMSGASNLDRKASRSAVKKSKKDNKRRFEKELQKILERDKRKKAKGSSKDRKKCAYAGENMKLEGMKKNIADVAHFLRKDRPDCSCCQCSATKGNRVCSSESCTQRRIKNIVDNMPIPCPGKNRTKRSTVTKRKDSKVAYKKDKERRRGSSMDGIRKGRGSRVSSPRMCVRASTLESPRKRESSLKEKSPTKEKSPRKSLEPCTNDTCGVKTTPRPSIISNIDVNQANKRRH